MVEITFRKLTCDNCVYKILRRKIPFNLDCKEHISYLTQIIVSNNDARKSGDGKAQAKTFSGAITQSGVYKYRTGSPTRHFYAHWLYNTVAELLQLRESMEPDANL